MKYKLIKSFRKTMSLQIKNGELIVKSPFFITSKTIEQFVQKHTLWIETRLETDKNKKIYSSNDILDLKKKAKDYIPLRVEGLAKKFWFVYNVVKITSARRRWWSCTSKKNLNFSFRLMDTPSIVIDYVIIHELSHLRHMNHSRRFWQEVESMMPNYKEQEDWLKKKWTLIT